MGRVVKFKNKTLQIYTMKKRDSIIPNIDLSFLNRFLRILLITNAIILIAGAMLGPIYAIFVEGIGGDLLDASLTAGVFNLAAGITTFIAGKYSDKSKHPVKIVIIGYFLMGIGFFLLVFVKSIYALFAVQALIGFSEALYNPAFDSLYSKHLKKKEAGEGWGAWESSQYFSVTVGIAIGGFITYFFGFAFLFILMSVFSMATALYLHLLSKKIKSF